jgi:hypothetical protein
VKHVWRPLAAGFLLLALLLPQPTLAEEIPEYSIKPIPSSGIYQSEIQVWATVHEAGTYHVCWNARSQAGTLTTLITTGSGNFSVSFAVPEGRKGEHTLYLTNDQFGELASAPFTVDSTTCIDPGKGPVGTEVTILGYGFTANEASIPIRFHGTQIRTVTADANGSWDTSHTIPSIPAGDYLFDVGPDREPDEVCDMCMCFTVTPAIEVSPTTGVSGQVITVSGTGFASNEGAIKVTFDGQAVKEGVSANANGSWSTQIAVPRRAADIYTIDASGFSTWARDVPDIPFEIETGVWVEPTEAQVGDEIAVTGSGFAPWEEDVRITFDGRVLDSGAIAVDRHGTWEASFVLPTSVYGAHQIGAYGVRTEADTVRKATLSTKARLGVNPGEASPGDSVTLTGNGFPANQTLTVTFANRAVQEIVRSSQDGSLSAIVTVPASPVGGLTITASGGGAQATDSFSVRARILPTPQPVEPQEDRTFRTKKATFVWGRIAGSYNMTVTYTLDISGPGGNRRFSDIEALSYDIPTEEALPRGDYTWQVKATDEFGNESLWSDPIPFRVSPIPTWVWVIVGLAVFTTLMVVAYREGKLKVTE